jgi:hypothetical protein
MRASGPVPSKNLPVLRIELSILALTFRCLPGKYVLVSRIQVTKREHDPEGVQCGGNRSEDLISRIKSYSSASQLGIRCRGGLKMLEPWS